MTQLKNTLQIDALISEDCNLPQAHVSRSIALFEEGATLPFIARYRKEATGGLDETQLRDIQTRFTYYTQLNERKETVQKSIQEQGKLTDDLAQRINACRDKQSLEDLYLPYKTKRKTKADIAIEKGFLPLADLIVSQQDRRSQKEILSAYPEEALEGAQHIIAQRVADNADNRQWLRDFMAKTAVINTKLTKKAKEESNKFEMYAEFSESLQRSASHRLLAIRRGEKEKMLSWKLVVNDDRILEHLRQATLTNRGFSLRSAIDAAILDAYKRLLFPSLQSECFNARCAEAETESIAVFSKNLHNLLMAAPAGAKVIMGLDPGFRTGSKLAVVDETGHYKASATIYPEQSATKREEAKQTLLKLITTHQVGFVAIGNGTGSKEAMGLVKALIKEKQLSVVPVIVNEAGASVYSASPLAVAEYPHLDVTIRGAISIAHRLQDPLSELVKIDPKSIGVGQYQHDVNQTHLKEALSFITESAVNNVGADLNTASSALLTYVSGIGEKLADNIVAYRNENGAFATRNTLLKVPKLGPKAYQQCAGFLRIANAKNPLDNSAIHPEAYAIVKRMADTLNIPISDLIGNDDAINQLDLHAYITDNIGLPTLQDIVAELKKPGRDPRAEFTYAKFNDAIDDIKDLTVGMKLEGSVTNVTNFGAFVDIGVHQDGLVHISKLSNSFVKNPHDVVAVGDTLTVTVTDVDMARKRIQLSAV